MKTRSFIIYIFPLAALAFTGCSGGSTDTHDPKDVAEEQNKVKFEDDRDARNDADFIVTAAENHLLEIRLGQLAQERSSNAEVQKLGQALVTEHTAALNNLKSLADSKRISIPETLTERAQKKLSNMSDASAREFDGDFCEMVADLHSDAMRKYQKASENTNDTDIQLWAADQLNMLRKHQDMAYRCKEQPAPADKHM